MGNNRNIGRHDENRASWRPQDDEMQNGIDSYGQGQSGYGSGRYREDRAFGQGNRNQSYGGRQGFQGNTDDRWSGRGGPMADDDRNYRAARGAQQYNQGRHGQNRAYDQSFAGYDREFDRNQWNSYSRDDDMPAHGMDQTMYGQGDGRSRQDLGYGRGPYGSQLANQHIGGHRGKGPMGYQRSDERIRENVCEALEHDDHVDATHIEVVVKNGEVILTGTVDDRRMKRMAEECIEHLAGVKDVQNNLRLGSERMARSSSNNNGNGARGHNETETSQTGGSDRKARA